MKSMRKKLKLSTACSQDNPVLKLNSASSDRLLRPFYTRNSDILAKKLLGIVLCRRDLVPNETIRNKLPKFKLNCSQPLLMIDDECDSASIDISARKSKKSQSLLGV